MKNNIMALIINGNYGANLSPDGQIDFLLQGKMEGGILENDIVSYPLENLLENPYKLEFQSFEKEEKEILHEVYYRKYMKEKFKKITSGMPISQMKEMQLSYLMSQIQCIVVRFSDNATTITMPKIITEKQKEALFFLPAYIPSGLFYTTSIYRIEKGSELIDGIERVNDPNGAIEEYFQKYINKKMK